MNPSDVVAEALGISNLSCTPTSIPNDLGWSKRRIMLRDTKVTKTERQTGDQVPEPVLYKPFISDGIHISYVTGSGSELELHIAAQYIPRQDIPIVTDWERISFCRDCRGSKGGCPGFSPLFRNIKPNVNTVLVLAVHMDLRWAVTYSRPKPTPTVMYPLTYADRLTLFYTNNLRKSVSESTGSYTLSLGNCTGCYGKKRCSVIINDECSNPSKRTFSVESVGIDVDELHYMLLGEYLPWYYIGTNALPTYMSRYALIFCENKYDYLAMIKSAVSEHISYKGRLEFDPDRGLGELMPGLLKIPAGVHVGSKQWVYNGLKFGSYTKKGKS